MGKTPSLNELATRKRLLQAHLEIHRSEIALYYHDILSPFERVGSRVTQLASNRWVRWGAIGAFGYLFFARRLGILRKVAGVAMPLLLPRLQGLIRSNALQWGMKAVQMLRSR
jgi:hypothetical protein